MALEQGSRLLRAFGRASARRLYGKSCVRSVGDGGLGREWAVAGDGDSVGFVASEASLPVKRMGKKNSNGAQAGW